MRLIILLLLASAFGYGLLQIEKIDPNNYVKMYIGNYVVEVKVLGFLLLLVGVVLVLYFLLWLFRLVWRSPKLFGNWRKRRNHDLAEQQLGAGYLSLIKGDWRKAESLLLKKSNHSAVPYVNYLAAAQAAQQQGRLEQRDDYLTAAYDAAPKERLAIGLTKAKLHQQAGQMDMALATLNDISGQGKKNPQYTAMLLQTYEQTDDWQNAQSLLPVAKKQDALPKDALLLIQNKIYMDSLVGAKDIEVAWRALPREQKSNVDNISVYARAMAKKGEAATAEKTIRSALKSTWSDELVNIYGALSSNKPAKLLRNVEGWLMARPENAQANLAAGRLALADKNYDSAKKYLQSAISLEQLPEAYAALGEVFENNNESGKALQLYRTGLQSMSGQANDQSALPLDNSTKGDTAEQESEAQAGELLTAEEKSA